MNSAMEEKLAVANDLREKEQYGEAAKIYTECLMELVKINDPEGLIHCLGGQSLIYKILSRQSRDRTYKNLTLSFAAEAYRIGIENSHTIDGRVLSIAYSSYGDALLMDGRFPEAFPLFQKSLEVSTAGVPEKGRLKAHIGGIKYVLGRKEEGIKEIEEALSDIRTGDMETYAIRVWETGALNGLAKIYALEGQKEKAAQIITESLQIALDHKLTIREREAQEIQAKISSGSKDFSL